MKQLAAERGERPAVTDQHRTVTWGELHRRTNRIARGLIAAGVKQGDLVTLGLPNSADFVEACYGLWKAGATPQPISWRLPAHEAEAVMELAETPILIAGETIASDRPRYDVAGPAGAERGRQRPRGPHRADLEGADLRRLDRPAEADPVGRPGRVRSCHRRAATGAPAKTPCSMPGPLYHNGPFTSLLRRTEPGRARGRHAQVRRRGDAAG